MKKTFYLLMMFAALGFTGCEPMEDIHDEIDAELEGRVQGTIPSYTVTEEDYTEFLELDQSYFLNREDANNDIPAILNERFPSLGKNSTVNVNFNIYAPIEPIEYEVTSADYSSEGLDVNYFSDEDEVIDFLYSKFFDLEEGSYVELTYDITSEVIEFTLDEDDYDEIGDALGDKYSEPAANAAQHNSFEIRESRDSYWSNDMIVEALGAVIDENYGTRPGQLYNVTYDTYAGSGNYGTPSLMVVYDGNKYIAVGARTYTLSQADYDLIGTELGDDYPGPAGNAAQYNSFDVNEGSDNRWTDDMILEAINVVLKDQFPGATEGAEFDVTVEHFINWETPAVTYSVVLEDGSYIINTNEPTVYVVEETQVYGLGNGQWKEPYVIPSNLYQNEFNQRYSNFDDEELVDHYIGTYLESLYPYAQEGDFVPVAYKFYNGERTVTKYGSFYYRNGNFELVPTVMETTVQFSHTGTDWEPDNTIRYVLTVEDYLYIADQLADVEGFVSPAANLADYENFYMGGGQNNWDEAMLERAMIVLLNHIAPDAQDGQKYLMVFTIYNRGEQSKEMRFIKTDGEWVRNE